MKKSHCMPRMMAVRSKTTATPVTSPASSLLQRFREVVLKLIMLSAMLKARAAKPAPATLRKGSAAASSATFHGADESYRSEAVEDCIAFVKRSAGIVSEGGSAAGSPASSSSI